MLLSAGVLAWARVLLEKSGRRGIENEKGRTGKQEDDQKVRGWFLATYKGVASSRQSAMQGRREGGGKKRGRAWTIFESTTASKPLSPALDHRPRTRRGRHGVSLHSTHAWLVCALLCVCVIPVLLEPRGRVGCPLQSQGVVSCGASLHNTSPSPPHTRSFIHSPLSSPHHTIHQHT